MQNPDTTDSRPDGIMSEAGPGPGEDRTEALTPTGAPPEDVDVVVRERDEYKDLLLRKTAEFDNYRRRIERERREQAELAAADLVKELLPVLDDLERAGRAAEGEQVEAYRKGVELIGRRLADLLARRGVVPIDPLGVEFTPHEHEAVMREARPGARENEVVEVLSRGYRMGARLLRPAMVKVASA
jgi:molecular chaperone GrpE